MLSFLCIPFPLGRVNDALTCMCGSNLALILQASDTVILPRNGAYLRFSQSGNINSSAFEVLLNVRIVFYHWFQSPDEIVAYDISVTVSISDGMFTNNATAVITVEVINVRPSVLLDGNVSGCDVLNHTVIWFVKWETVDAVAFDYFCVSSIAGTHCESECGSDGWIVCKANYCVCQAHR